MRIYFLRSSLVILCLSTFPMLSGCDSSQIKGMISPVKREALDKICEARGGLSSPGPLNVDGYYLPRASPMFGIDEVIAKLGQSRFQFFEMDTSWVNRSGTWGAFNLRKVKGEGRYTRFYVADRGDSNCEAFENYLQKPLYGGRAERKARLRGYGIYPEHCIAAIRTDELKSKYGIEKAGKIDPDIPEITWYQSLIRNIDSGEVYADYSEFKHCFKGRKDNGACRGRSRDIYMCRPKDPEHDNPVSAIYSGTFKATPNPYLKKKLTSVEIREPLSIKQDIVTPELVVVIEGEKNLKKLYKDEVLDLYMSIDAEGYAWFSKRSEKWQEGEIKYNTPQAQVWIINDISRKLLKIDIGIADPKMRKNYDYCCLRAIEGDGVYFIAWGGRKERTEPAENFKILKYSWEGELVKITAGTLPFDFYAQTSQENLVHYYGKLKIVEEGYFFTVIERVKGVLAADPFRPTKEYRIKVPLN